MVSLALQTAESVSKALFDGLAGAVAGGVAGSLVMIWSERRNNRMEVALKITDQFMSQYGELAIVKGLLADPDSLTDVTNLNMIRKFGDWCEIVAAVCLGKVADHHLLALLDIRGQMTDFVSAVKKANVEDLNSALKSWTNLSKYIGE
jgi:hypothetical protein